MRDHRQKMSALHSADFGHKTVGTINNGGIDPTRSHIRINHCFEVGPVLKAHLQPG